MKLRGREDDKLEQVTTKIYSGSKTRGQRRKRKTSMEIEAGHRRIARQNNKTDMKFSRGSFAVPKNGPVKGLAAIERGGRECIT